MNSLILVARTFGVFLAILFAINVIVGLSGNFNLIESPPLPQRALSQLPTAMLSILLFLPQRFLLRGARYKAALAAFMLATTALVVTLGRDIVRSLSGEVHWAPITVAAIFVLVVIGNGFSLWALHRTLPPNNSFKPRPLRGSA